MPKYVHLGNSVLGSLPDYITNPYTVQVDGITRVDELSFDLVKILTIPLTNFYSDNFPEYSLVSVGASGNVKLSAKSFDKDTQQDLYYTLRLPDDIDYDGVIDFYIECLVGSSYTSGTFKFNLEVLRKDLSLDSSVSGVPEELSVTWAPSNATDFSLQYFGAFSDLVINNSLLLHLTRDISNDSGDDFIHGINLVLVYHSVRLGVL